jgi:hypothetical protein
LDRRGKRREIPEAIVNSLRFATTFAYDLAVRRRAQPARRVRDGDRTAAAGGRVRALAMGQRKRRSKLVLMKETYGKGVAIRFRPKSCAGGDIACEALTGAHAGTSLWLGTDFVELMQSIFTLGALGKHLRSINAPIETFLPGRRNTFPIA